MAMEKLAELAPTDYYYEKLLAGLLSRHPKADKHLLDHLVSLEAFLEEYSGGFLVWLRQSLGLQNRR